MIAVIVLVSMAAFAIAYRVYGRFLSRAVGIDDTNTTPACEINDGVDYVPAKSSLLIGQHFSAIAAAGPIVGPILAGLWFGWLPALLWILFGAIFVGGVHDFASLIASVRHRGTSIGELLKQYMSPTAHVLFLGFVWLTLVYVIIAFTDITAQTFRVVAQGQAFGPGVAVSSVLYLVIGVAMGVLLYKFKLNLTIATAIFLPLLVLIVWGGNHLPASLVAFMASISTKEWDIILLIYCFVASLLPMWLLLQPRGYLGGWFLYLTIATGLFGALFGGFSIQYPAFNTEALRSIDTGKFMFPLLFITIACGACSGFHAIVSSGTTSKQLRRESDARVIGYGTMLLEGVVAVLALATVMMLPKGDAMLQGDPNLVYANGLARYLGLIGVNFNLALAFALLAFSTFVYDTLDVCTRLARYILQELLGWKSKAGAYLATFVTLFVPFVFLMATKEKGYIVAWPIFGTSNQLLASLSLLALSVWLYKTGKSYIYAVIPMAFMLSMTLWSLVLLILPFLKALLAGAGMKPEILVAGCCGLPLLILTLWLVYESLDVLWLKPARENRSR
jgi:carbon starvation protein